MSESRTLTIKQVAELLGVSTAAVRKWSRQGRFPSGVKLGRSRRWLREVVERWLKEQAEKQACSLASTFVTTN